MFFIMRKDIERIQPKGQMPEIPMPEIWGDVPENRKADQLRHQQNPGVKPDNHQSDALYMGFGVGEDGLNDMGAGSG